jgi:hypothetical protein
MGWLNKTKIKKKPRKGKKIGREEKRRDLSGVI